MHLSKLLIIHTYTQHVTWKPIQEKSTRCSSSGNGMRKQMHILSVHKAIDYAQDILFYPYILILPLMLSILLYLYHSTLLLLSDPHIAWIEQKFSISIRTQLQIHYSDALNDPELPTQNCCILYSAQKCLNKNQLTCY